MSSTNYYYSDKIEWDNVTGKYILKNEDESSVTTSAWSSNYSSLLGKYTCFSATDTSCISVYYIGGATGSYAYYVTLSNGNDLSKYLNVSNNISYDATTGLYTLNNPTNVASTWYTDYNNYKGYYFCSDLNSTTCNTVHYINSVSNYYETYINMTDGETYDNIINNLNNSNWLYGNSVTYDGTNYTLTDTIGYSPMTWDDNYNKINNNHYTCFSTSNTCSTVYYIYYATSTTSYYIPLTGGKKVEDALSDMFDSNINNSIIKGNSTISGTIDYWYAKNMTSYTNNYIEDTVYCNDRSITQKNGVSSQKNGWDPDNGYVGKDLYFGAYGRKNNPSVICPRISDTFSVSNSIGNGKLDYPVGLLTADEIILAGGSDGYNYNYYLWNGVPGSNSSSGATKWWTASPLRFSSNNASIWSVSDGGYLSGSDVVYSTRGIRPVISIKHGIRTSGGEGTKDDPYTLEEIE